MRFDLRTTAGTTTGGFWDENILGNGPVRVYEAVWDRTNGILLCYVNGILAKFHGVKKNDNLKEPLISGSDYRIYFGRDAAGNSYDSRYELLIVDNKLPWWYRYIDYSDENEYHALDHPIYLDPSNPIPIGTEPTDPDEFLHCWLFNGDVNDYGSSPQNFTLYGDPGYETGLIGSWVSPPSVGTLETTLGPGSGLPDLFQTIEKGHSFCHKVQAPVNTTRVELYKIEGAGLSPLSGVNVIRDKGFIIAHRQMDEAGEYLLIFRDSKVGFIKTIDLKVVDTPIE